MSLKFLVLIAVGLMAAQTFIVIAVTRANHEFFPSLPATHYSQALRELAKSKPLAAFVIRLCYALSLLELLALVFAKYVLGLAP